MYRVAAPSDLIEVSEKPAVSSAWLGIPFMFLFLAETRELS